ncbi:flavin reductase family protein [Pseudooceanicola sp. MF1-13]|uniref:flavin reductase family protein n=1 Tax=Pseudooceanicola sp. MF1-13 TaxID=3379095 RepID=UPI0038921080
MTPRALPAIDPRALRDACGRFATGVTVISTVTEDGDHGMTANAFMSISLDPPLISISLDRKARMLGKVREARRYAVSILTSGMEPLARHFAGRADPTVTQPFAHLQGVPVVPGASAVFVADVTQEVEAGDHVLFIGRVRHMELSDDAQPLLFYGGRFGAVA